MDKSNNYKEAKKAKKTNTFLTEYKNQTLFVPKLAARCSVEQAMTQTV